MELKDRIAELIRYKGINASAFAVAIGARTKQAIYELLKGNTKSLSQSMMQNITAYMPELNMQWLLTGEGEMLLSEPEQTPRDDDDGLVKVPLINLDARGGFDGNSEQGNPYTHEMIAWNGARNGDMAVEVSGISMMPQIPPGSRVLLRLVEQWREYLEKNLPYVIELNDGRRLLKVVQKSDKGEKYLDLMSYNPDVPTEPLPVDMVRRIYKVVGTMINYGF